MIVDYVQPVPLIYQTDSRFAKLGVRNMRPSGCFFMAVMETLCGIFRIPFTIEFVATFFKQEIGDGDIDVDNEMTLESVQDLLNDFCAMVGRGKLEYIVENGTSHLAANREFSDEEVEWGCWHKTGRSYKHFTHNNGKHIVLYDSWSSEGSDSVRDGILVSCRGARLISL